MKTRNNFKKTNNNDNSYDKNKNNDKTVKKKKYWTKNGYKNSQDYKEELKRKREKKKSNYKNLKLQFPKQLIVHKDDVPWWCNDNEEHNEKNIVNTNNNEEDISADTNTKNTANSSNSYYSSFSASFLNHLDSEISDFCSYVKLTKIEKNARHFLVKEIEDLCYESFPEIPTDKIDVRMYGSFATDLVATYNADVDLAIWGLVDEDYISKASARNKEEKQKKKKESICSIKKSSQKKREWLLSLQQQLDPKKAEKWQNEYNNCINEKMSGIVVEETQKVQGARTLHAPVDDTTMTSEKPFLKEDKQVDDGSSIDNSITSSDEPSPKDSDQNEEEEYDDDNDSNTSSQEESNLNITNKPVLALPRNIGPRGEERTAVLKVLKRIYRKLHSKKFFPYVSNLEFRSHARVPILVYDTKFNIEMNIALGGHNGIDTSHFANGQCNKYKSFASVVLVLKMLLRQMDLDKPFTGGIGSYKLYVLVAYHMQRHLQLGGVDRPSEVLLTFLYRYGNKLESQYITPLCKELVIPIHPINFTQVKTLENAEGFADLSSIFKIDHCVLLFEKTYDLFQRHDLKIRNYVKKNINNKNNKQQDVLENYSLLSSIIDIDILKYHRTNIENSANDVYGFSEKRKELPICFNNNNTTVVSSKSATAKKSSSVSTSTSQSGIESDAISARNIQEYIKESQQAIANPYKRLK